MLLRNRGFTVVALATLALGIGANSAMFIVLDAVLLRMLPVREPARMFVVTEISPKEQGPAGLSWPSFQRLRASSAGIADLIATTRSARFNLRSPGGAIEPVEGQLVSGEFFPVLGVRAAAGRLLTADDNRDPGGHPVAVMSHGYWRRRHAADAGVVGRAVALNGTAFTIVGIAEPGFFGVRPGESPALWLPLVMQAELRYSQNAASSGGADTRKPWPPQEDVRWLQAMARTADPVATRAALNVAFAQDVARAAGRHSDRRERDLAMQRRLDLEPGGRGFAALRQRVETPVTALMAMTGLVLLIACANVANLL
ncbi:MAG: ABC transporter permease, partial [Bryobacteraceae bacterium]